MDYQRRRDGAVAYLGGKCVDCNSTDDLQFDHRNANEKSFDIAENLNRRWDSLVGELDKCDLRCRPCHIAKTKANGESGGGWNKGLRDPDKHRHGTATRYQMDNCRCDPCRTAAALAKGRRPPTQEYISRSATHGSPSMYGYHKCRCDICREGNRLRAQTLREKKNKPT